MMPKLIKSILQRYDFSEDELLQVSILTDLQYAYFQDLLTQLVNEKARTFIDNVNEYKTLLMLARIDGKIDLLSMLLENHDNAINEINKRTQEAYINSQILEAQQRNIGDDITSMF